MNPLRKIEKDLVEFHKSQKTGFYSFEPYQTDFFYNIVYFSKGYHGKDIGDLTISALVVIKWIDDFTIKHFDLYIKLKPLVATDDSASVSANYRIYPDCVKKWIWPEGVYIILHENP